MKKSEPNFIIYAIREIILVVIGILIAVSINNWNEKRKQNHELNNILLKVGEELKNDIAKIDEVFETYEQTDTIFKNVLASKYSSDDYKTNPEIAFIIFGYPELSFNQRGVSLLKNFKGDMSNQKEAFAQELIEFYNKQLWEIKVDDDLRSEDFKENFKYWKNNTNWWSDFVQLDVTDDFIKYALESKDYKTRVATAQFFTYKVYLPEINKFCRGK